MKKDQIKVLCRLCAFPALLIVVGLVLLLNPDSAIALVTKILAWVFMAAGVVRVIGILADKSWARLGQWVWPVLFIAVGSYFLRHPLMLANIVGRVIGLVMIVAGINDLRESSYGASKVLSVVTAAVGVVLVLLPRTLTQTVIIVCGLVLVIVGVVNLLEKLREYKLLENGSDPNIIDADE